MLLANLDHTVDPFPRLVQLLRQIPKGLVPIVTKLEPADPKLRGGRQSPLGLRSSVSNIRRDEQNLGTRLQNTSRRRRKLLRNVHRLNMSASSHRQV